MGRGGTDCNPRSLGQPRLAHSSAHSDNSETAIERRREDPANTESQSCARNRNKEADSSSRAQAGNSTERNHISKYACLKGEVCGDKVIPRRNLMMAFEACGEHNEKNSDTQSQTVSQASRNEQDATERASISKPLLAEPKVVDQNDRKANELQDGVLNPSPTGVDEFDQDREQETSQTTSQDGQPDNDKIRMNGMALKRTSASQTAGSHRAEGATASWLPHSDSSTISPPATEPTGKQPTENSSQQAAKAQAESPFIRSDTGKNERLELPVFHLHASLKRDLSQALVNRVSFYGIIHDINKEANSMASNDPSFLHCSESSTESLGTPSPNEESCSLVVAVNGPPPSRPFHQDQKVDPRGTMTSAAVVDEERWLLSAIASRSFDEISDRACPLNFAEAIGEQEAGEGPEGFSVRDPNGQSANPLSALTSSRTQLWKPSRSWWEAKSGKNPWIEPASHNKRWRYLWPLIHYHKFLARCIKKLKRNGVDVKTSVSPVSVFLREEVCAVSDHLAAVSKFTADEWMGVLEYFKGWTDNDPDAQEVLREFVSRQKLRGLVEPCDVDSPLLRDQIAEHFLKAVAASRGQTVNSSKGPDNGVGYLTRNSQTSMVGSGGYPAFPSNFSYHNGENGPTYTPSGQNCLPSDQLPLHDMIRQRLRHRGGKFGSKPRRSYHSYQNMWVQPPPHFGGDPGYGQMYPSHHHNNIYNHYSMYNDPAGHYFPQHHNTGPAIGGVSSPHEYYHNSYPGHMNFMFPIPNSYQVEQPPPEAWNHPVGPIYESPGPAEVDGGIAGRQANSDDDQLPPHNNQTELAKPQESNIGEASHAEANDSSCEFHNYQPVHQVPPSPFWGFSEQAMTPQSHWTSDDASIQSGDVREEGEEHFESPAKRNSFVGMAASTPEAHQLLMNPSPQFYHGQYAQFHMSPQANPQAAAYFSHYGFPHDQNGLMAPTNSPYSPYGVGGISETHELPVHHNTTSVDSTNAVPDNGRSEKKADPNSTESTGG